MYDLITYIVVTCDGDISVSVAERVMHKNGLQETVTIILKAVGANNITSK